MCLYWKPIRGHSSQPISLALVLVTHCRDAKSATQPPCLTWRSHSREDVQPNDMLLVHPSPHSVVQSHLHVLASESDMELLRVAGTSYVWDYCGTSWILNFSSWLPSNQLQAQIIFALQEIKFLQLLPSLQENKYEAVPSPLESSTPNAPWPTPTWMPISLWFSL